MIRHVSVKDMQELSETIMEINDLHKLILKYQELEQNRKWTPTDANTLKSDPLGARSSRPPCLVSRQTHPCLQASFLGGSRDARHGDRDGRSPNSRPLAVAVALPRNCLTLNGIHIIL